MTNIVAKYATNNDATIKVINSGYINGKLKQIEDYKDSLIIILSLVSFIFIIFFIKICII